MPPVGTYRVFDSRSDVAPVVSWPDSRSDVGVIYEPEVSTTWVQGDRFYLAAKRTMDVVLTLIGLLLLSPLLLLVVQGVFEFSNPCGRRRPLLFRPLLGGRDGLVELQQKN